MCITSAVKCYSNELIFHQSLVILLDNRYSNSWKSVTHAKTGNFSVPTVLHKSQSSILWLGHWFPFLLFPTYLLHKLSPLISFILQFFIILYYHDIAIFLLHCSIQLMPLKITDAKPKEHMTLSNHFRKHLPKRSY